MSMSLRSRVSTSCSGATSKKSSSASRNLSQADSTESPWLAISYSGPLLVGLILPRFGGPQAPAFSRRGALLGQPEPSLLHQAEEPFALLLDGVVFVDEPIGVLAGDGGFVV